MKNSTTSEYSSTYRELTASSIKEALNLGLPNKTTIDPYKRIDNIQLKFIKDYLWYDFYPKLAMIMPDYWGNKCQMLSCFLYARLKSIGFDADLIVGEVNINGTLEFDTTLDIIRNEWNSSTHEGDQTVHVWVSVGDDIIIDAGIPDRMIKYYKYPEEYMPSIMIGRANDLYREFMVKHHPMLVGRDFIHKTNSSDPEDLATHFKNHGFLMQ